MMKVKAYHILMVLLMVTIPFIYAYYVYPMLPDRIPTHFNMQGEADGWGSRDSIYLLPAIMGIASLLVFFLLANIKKLDPKRSAKTDNAIYQNFALLTVAFLCGLSLVIVYGTAHRDVSVNKLIFGWLGITFAAMGLLMPRLRQNYFAGFRLPWTLDNEENWNATHQLAGKYWSVGGIGQVVVCVMLDGKPLFIAFMVIMAVMLLVPIVFSYRMFRKKTG